MRTIYWLYLVAKRLQRNTLVSVRSESGWMSTPGCKRCHGPSDSRAHIWEGKGSSKTNLESQPRFGSLAQFWEKKNWKLVLRINLESKDLEYSGWKNPQVHQLTFGKEGRNTVPKSGKPIFGIKWLEKSISIWTPSGSHLGSLEIQVDWHRIRWW